MTIIQSIILGIIEGITEFLPVSSTGHLILVSDLLGIIQTSFIKTFTVAIQLGAILAVVVLYWKRFLVKKEVWKKVFTAFIPTGIIGFILYKLVKTFLLGNEWVVVGSLFVVGIILIVFEIWYGHPSCSANKVKYCSRPNEVLKISYKQSFLIGVIQSFGMIPGVSRSGATILGGLFMGVERSTIVEFSFLLAIPTMLAATGYDLLRNYQTLDPSQFHLLAIGFVVSFLVAIPSIKFLIGFVQKNNFTWFGVYRIVVAVIFALIIL
uniref:Undecaprenyl-diphosphatase n=1 Tax=candidate division CPR3 bacterium TaxID=2268181 RepID=A0A7C4R653_UNCC3